MHVEVTAADAGTRLDKYLAAQVPELSRSQLQRLIQEGQVQLLHSIATTSTRVREGDVITLTIPPPRPAQPVPEAIDLQIVHEDDALLVINKPPGLVVHPAPGHASGTLVNALLFHCQTLSGVGGEERPGIVHRLDKDTSGLLLVAKHDRSHRHLSAQLQTHTLQRRYLALVRGRLPAMHGTVDAPIGRHPQHRQKMAVVARGGRAARTHYQVLETWGPLSLLQLTLETGRTHQIRVHLAHLGHPVMGDPLYGSGPLRWPAHAVLEQVLNAFPRQALHAEHIRFQHPDTDAWCAFSAALPGDMLALVTHLRLTGARA
ncbi:MAG: RluA family pseudouridine synthase [Candidatus Tectomicrobia bacterium]|uniref:Pseudouridine synthase n=1 Tax=Tectimicrobiota bacterium TaxID=2528274 RepID=A0A937W371_UNCTE|nr:RluA family pseudouridine synthase [Candidatus Tectomicrobia bacterium]